MTCLATLVFPFSLYQQHVRREEALKKSMERVCLVFFIFIYLGFGQPYCTVKLICWLIVSIWRLVCILTENREYCNEEICLFKKQCQVMW